MVDTRANSTWLRHGARCSSRFPVFDESKAVIEHGSRRGTPSGSVMLRLVTVEEERVELVLVLDDDVTIDRIRGAWQQISLQRQSLHFLQGEDSRDAPIWIQHLIAKEWEAGHTANEIADAVNFVICVLICRYVIAENEGNLVDHFRSFGFAESILSGLRRSRQESLVWLSDIVETLEQGERLYAGQTMICQPSHIYYARNNYEEAYARGEVVIPTAPLSDSASVDEIEARFHTSTALAERILGEDVKEDTKEYRKELMRKLLAVWRMRFPDDMLHLQQQ